MMLPIDIRIVIPCYHEPEIMQTLQSLRACRRPACGVEVLVVVNSYSLSPAAVKAFNRQTYRELSLFAETHSETGWRWTPLLVEALPGHQTGAGLPRQTGMDRAAAQFEAEGRRQGVIVSLDADCRVAENYLTEIDLAFRHHGLRSATLAFHHPVEHLPVDDPIRKATVAYESYLRYYRAALEYTGYPYPYYTIGSAFAVTAETYRRAGGMGKQQAGEDFYFLQKVFPLGRTRLIDSTCVYPAARLSDRVPFGTGPAVARMVSEGQFRKRSYRVEAFEELKQLFEQIDACFKQTAPVVEAGLQQLPLHTRKFLEAEGFVGKILEISRHTSTPASFRKRFFDYFSAFRILKYLNAVHPHPYEPAEVETVGWPELRRRGIGCV
jgi:hypothetical protein